MKKTLTTCTLAITGLLLTFIATNAQTATPFGYEAESETVVPKERELAYYGIRSWPFGKIPQDARQRALEQMSKMSRFSDLVSPLADDSWEQIGPFEVGGRIRSIAVHPTDGQTLWVGAADGGVWKSTDRGNNWTPVMNNTNAISMGAVAVDPSNPDILYAGTGEMSSNVDAYTGAGVFKSDDGGESWRVVGLTNVGAFAKIAVDPNDGNVVWAGATKNNSGFYRSTNGGTTWTKTYDRAISDIVVNPHNSSEVWIALTTGGIRYSDDGGETFVNRNNGLGRSGDVLNRVTIDICASQPEILYALGYEHEQGNTSRHYARLYKTTDGGENWTRVYNGSGSADFLANQDSQGWYNNEIAVKPDNPDVVIAGGVRMVRTTNGGANWNSIGNNVHVDHHAFEFDPANPDRLYAGNDGGMARSDNAGTGFSIINNGLAVSQFYAMRVDQRAPSLTYGGTQDNGTLTTNSTRYGDVLGGDGFYVDIDYSTSNRLYVERERGQIYRIDGNSATPLWFSLSTTTDVNWSAPMMLDPNSPDRLYSGRAELFVSLNPTSSAQNVQWLRVSPRMPGNISAMAVSPHNSDVIIIGSAQGVIQRTTDLTDTWDNLSFERGLPNRGVTDFMFSRDDPNTIYVTFSGFFTDHIYKTTDLGDSWSSISEGLPDIPFTSIELHPDDEDIIFAGSDLGVFISLNGGESWAVYDEGMPRVGIVDLEMHLDSKSLRAATHGRSMYERGVGGEEIVLQPSITSPIGGEVWIGATPHTVSWGGFDDPAGIKLEYTLDDGQTWRTLGTGVAGNVFRWNVVNTSTYLARVKVTSMTDPEVSIVSNTFTISNFGQGAVLLTDSKPVTPYGIASDGEFLWTTDFSSNRLFKLDPETLNAVEIITMGPTAGDSLFTDLTYYPPRETFMINRLNSTTQPNSGGAIVEVHKDGTVRGVWQSLSAYPIGMAWLGGVNPDVPFLMASDRDDDQLFFFYDPEAFNPSSSTVLPVFTYDRADRVESGPRGLAADTGTFWHVVTDFSGGSLQDANVFSVDIEDATEQAPICNVSLTSPLATTINGRGVEVDRDDQSLWISDFGGNIYKIASCYTQPGATDTGTASSVGVDELNEVVAGLKLANSPNPFTDATTFTFELPQRSGAEIVVYNSSGDEVVRMGGKAYSAGTHDVRFDPIDLPAGVYRATLTVNGHIAAHRSIVHVK